MTGCASERVIYSTCVDVPSGLKSEPGHVAFGGLKVLEELVHIILSVRHRECFRVVWLSMTGIGDGGESEEGEGRERTSGESWRFERASRDVCARLRCALVMLNYLFSI